jgi:hypothetical protein
LEKAFNRNLTLPLEHILDVPFKTSAFNTDFPTKATLFNHIHMCRPASTKAQHSSTLAFYVAKKIGSDFLLHNVGEPLNAT